MPVCRLRPGKTEYAAGFTVKPVYDENLSVMSFQGRHQAVFIAKPVGDRQQSCGFIDDKDMIVLVEQFVCLHNGEVTGLLAPYQLIKIFYPACIMGEYNAAEVHAFSVCRADALFFNNRCNGTPFLKGFAKVPVKGIMRPHNGPDRAELPFEREARTRQAIEQEACGNQPKQFAGRFVF